MITRLLSLALLGAVLSACNDSSSSSSGSSGTTPTPPAPTAANPEIGPLISGEMRVISGMTVWTDYAYDDRGSNSNGLPGGDSTYPEPPHPGNTADLIQLQIGTNSQGALQITALLQTLVEGHDALLGVGFDTDLDSNTGAATLPGETWSNDGPLGLEELVLLDSNGEGRHLKWINSQWLEVSGFAVTTNRERNTVSATLAALKPNSGSWNAIAALGPVADQQAWADGSGDIFDLAFVRGEDPVTDPALALQEQVPQIQRPWQDKRQADILAGQAPAADAIATIDFGAPNTTADAVDPGLHTFLYRSPLTLEEGVRPDPLQYRGIFQPYVVMIPEGLPAEPPAIIFMHGADQNHLVNAVHFSEEGLVIPGFYSVPAVIVFPMGRDPTWGTGLSEQDLLDATDDAIARLNLNADRIVLSGISAGGIGTFRHAARYPDKWTGGYSIVGGGTRHLGNLRNLPLRAHNGLLDPLVDVVFWQESADALAATDGVDYRTVLVHTTSHLPSALGNCRYLEMLATDRQINPARVSYTVDPGDFFVDPAANLDLRPRSAYWVLALQSRDEMPASIDAVSLARADRERLATDIDRYDSSLTGADFCGPNPDSVGADTWQELGRSQQVAPAASTENAMVITLTNLASATLDVPRMGLNTAEVLTINSNSDQATELILVGQWPPSTSLTRNGATQPTPRVDGDQLRFTIAAGEHQYRLQ